MNDTNFGVDRGFLEREHSSIDFALPPTVQGQEVIKSARSSAALAAFALGWQLALNAVIIPRLAKSAFATHRAAVFSQAVSLA